MKRNTTTRRSALSKFGTAAFSGALLTLGSSRADAAEDVELRIKGSQSGINYRVEYNTGQVETGSVGGSSDLDVYSISSDAAVDRVVVKNTNGNSAAFELEHGNPDALSANLDGDVWINSPNDKKTQYELHTPIGGRAKVYSSYTEVFQDESKQSDRYKCEEKADGAIINNKDRWDFEGQFRFVVLDLSANAEFELTRDLL